MDIKTTVAPITERMEQVSMTRADLVRAAGMSRTQVDLYLSGDVAPSVSAWMRLVDAVGMKVDLSPSVDILPTAKAGGFLRSLARKGQVCSVG